MPCSRVLLSLVVLTYLATSCRFFRPYDPNAPRTKTPKAAETQPEPAVQAAVEAPPAPLEKRRDVGTVSDATIAAMILVSNSTDISYARLVPSRGQRQDVREFAARMLTDHAGVTALLDELLKKIDLIPEDNNASLDMRDVSMANRDRMRDLTGYTFDSTYIENEIMYHRRFLSDIDDIMLRRARNDDLKNLLTTIRPAVAAHLAHAEQVRANVLSRK